jgi:AraC-like DNA-binding protein
MHETYAIGVVEIGANRLRYRGATHLISAGGVVVVEPGEVHTGEPAGTEGWTYRMMYPPSDLVERVAREAGASSDVPRLVQPLYQDVDLARRFVHVHQVLERGGDPLRLEILLHDWLTELLQRHAQMRPRSLRAAPEGVRRVREYLEERYAHPVTLSELSRVANLSRFHLIRVFRRAVGLPPYMYLELVRVARAKELLCAGMPTSQVAYATGFSDQSHLTRRFKRVVGVPPGQYARSQRQAQPDLPPSAGTDRPTPPRDRLLVA